MDAIIPVAIVLFILSMINERIANYIKLQFSNKKLLWIKLGNLSIKSMDPILEDDRTKRIIAINIVCGSVVAVILRVDLINILGHMEHPYEAIGWDKALPVKIWGWLTLPIGCLLTGCFTSLGSKFWHDLLDLLLYTKNLKGKLLDERTYEQLDDIDQLQEFICTPEYKLSRIAVDSYGTTLKSIPGVLAIGTGYILNGSGKIGCMEVHVSQISVADQLPKETIITLNSGATVKVPVKKIVTGGYPVVSSALAGKGISNKTGQLGKGTIGAIVKDITGANRYILSCFHVLNGDSNWSRISDVRQIIDENNEAIAELYFGFRTTDMDVAIAKLNDGVDFSNSLINNPAAIREIVYNDVIRSTPVSVLGAKTRVTSNGIIYNDTWSATFKYPGGNLWELNDLLVLTRLDNQTNTYKPISQQGDSGALVIDDKNQAIGLLVGADQTFSYAIKLDKIAKSLDITL